MARRPRGQLRQDILDTVIDLLMDTGDVASVSIDTIVDRVGCTPPALYYYFPTKNDLLWQACEAEFAKLAEHIEGQVADVEARDRAGDRALHICARAGTGALVLRLLELGADPTARNVAGVTNQRSMPGPEGGRPPRSIRQTAPFLNSSGWRAPMRRAASAPRSGSCPTSAIPFLRA